MIKLIAACSTNRVIGNNNSLIWNIPDDLKRFKKLTTGHNILMGRKTFESIGKALPNRRNIILSRNLNFNADNCLVYNNIEEVLSLYKNDLIVIGGEEIYKQTIKYASILELTLIHKEYEGDAFFPVIPSLFKEINREDSIFNNIEYSYITYQAIN